MGPDIKFEHIQTTQSDFGQHLTRERKVPPEPSVLSAVLTFNVKINLTLQIVLISCKENFINHNLDK